MSLGLYIHIPFCKSKCPYCSFASFAGKDELIEPYLAALKKEARFYKGCRVSSIYIGGGTPTFLGIPQIRSLGKIIRSHFSVEKGAEITIEANPATFDAEKAGVLFELKFNRVSLGVQSLDDRNLKYLGRPQGAADCFLAFKTLRGAGFKNISLDLIYSLPAQTREDIKKEVSGLMALDSEHIALYTLSSPEGSAFYRQKIKLPDPERQGEDYVLISQLLERRGFSQYEVSNFAKTGYACRHNLNYWRGGDYIGLGAAAHSHRKGRRFWNSDKIEIYADLMEKKGSAKVGEEKLTQEQRFMETFLIGLRLTQGVDMKGLQRRFKRSLAQDKKKIIADFIEQGMLAEEEGRLKATFSGRVVLDEICGRLI
jgi:oxygen-independent coproporphyrinogen-3 oxidase